MISSINLPFSCCRQEDIGKKSVCILWYVYIKISTTGGISLVCNLIRSTLALILGTGSDRRYIQPVQIRHLQLPWCIFAHIPNVGTGTVFICTNCILWLSRFLYFVALSLSMVKVQHRSITDILGKKIVATVPDTVTTWSASGDIPTRLPAIA